MRTVLAAFIAFPLLFATLGGASAQGIHFGIGEEHHDHDWDRDHDHDRGEWRHRDHDRDEWRHHRHHHHDWD